MTEDERQKSAELMARVEKALAAEFGQEKFDSTLVIVHDFSDGIDTVAFTPDQSESAADIEIARVLHFAAYSYMSNFSKRQLRKLGRMVQTDRASLRIERKRKWHQRLRMR